MRERGILCGLLFASSWVMPPWSVAHAQEAPGSTLEQAGDSPGVVEEVVVTARKRNETLLSVPVTVSVVTAEALSTRGITNLEGLSRTIPSLFIANSSGGFQGGTMGLRGVSVGDSNYFGDQAVAFVIDGVQVARATPRKLSMFDMRQVQVMKGPQALYFGKNSPGGVVAIDTADPTQQLEAGLNSQYEFNGREWRTEGFVSGPLTDSLGARVALYGVKLQGWSENTAPAGTIYSPDRRRTPDEDEFGGRVTLKFDNGGPLDARFKFNYGRVSNDGFYNNAQLVSCPQGTATFDNDDDCRADDRVDHSYGGTRFGTGGAHTTTGAAIPGVPFFGDGRPYSKVKQYLSGLEINYALSDELSLTSTSGYYKADISLLDNNNQADANFPTAMLFAYADIGIREISQELRLASSYLGPVNFMAGAYYQDQELSYAAAAALNAVNPTQLFPPILLEQGGQAWSVFGSVDFRLSDTLELSGGARYSDETKDISYYRLLPGSVGGVPYAAGEKVPTAVPERSFDNVSPEVTLTWRPTSRFTGYAGWKRGFLSGGFNATGTGTSVAVIPDRSYKQQIVEGFEGGIKAILLGGDLQLNAALYDYDIEGLQVTVTLPGPPTVQVVNNAASARSRGAEADFNYQTPLPGLSLRGAISYNEAEYLSFLQSPCYAGQRPEEGCNLGFVGTAFTQQDLSGQPLVRAPEWGGSIGVTYEREDGAGNRFVISADGNYTSGFFTDALNSPGGRQEEYWLLDASARYELANGLSVAVIGRNLTDEYYFQRSSGAPLTGSGTGTPTGIQADQVAYVSRGREVAIKLSYQF